MGASLNKRTGKWHAYYYDKGRRIHLGYTETQQQALGLAATKSPMKMTKRPRGKGYTQIMLKYLTDEEEDLYDERHERHE